MKYAGIGSRSTPPDIMRVMEDFAYAAANESILRSGGADGADLAFEFGATLGGGKTEIFLPWKGFNGRLNGLLTEPTIEARAVAAYHHPGWNHLKPPAKSLIARNSHQILGANLMDPVEMVVCWTPDGSLDGKGRKSGGTGQALRIAVAYDIEVWNLAREDQLAQVLEVIGADGIPLDARD